MYDIVLGRSSGDVKKYGKKGTVYVGKQYVQMGATSSLSNPIYMDVARAHAMLIVGKRGGGKCLSENTTIILDSGELIKIKDLESNKKNIISLNTNYKLEQVEKTNFYSRKVKELYKIQLNSGKTLELTSEHPLLTVNAWEQTKNLIVGDRIATPRKMPVEGKKPIGLEKAKLLGYLIAEGHLGNNFILFTNTDEIINEDFKNSILKFDETLQIKEHSPNTLRVIQNNKRQITFSKRNDFGQFERGIHFDSKSSLRKWLDNINLYNNKSESKFIPKCLLTAPNSEIKEFLKVIINTTLTFFLSLSFWRRLLCLFKTLPNPITQDILVISTTLSSADGEIEGGTGMRTSSISLAANISATNSRLLSSIITRWSPFFAPFNCRPLTSLPT